MREFMYLELIRKLKSEPFFRRRFKIFLGVALVFLFLAGGLVVWGGIAATKYVMGLSSNPKIQYGIQSVQDQVKNIVMNVSTLQNAACWNKAQSLLTVRAWLDKPMADNFRNLKIACMENKQPLCEGTGCGGLKNYLNTAEKGGTI